MSRGDVQVYIYSDIDVANAVCLARGFAARAGLTEVGRCKVVTVVSELATNIVRYAGCGRVRLREVEEGGRSGVEVLAEDEGPGIEDIPAALRDHFSTGGSLGLGLPGVRRLMDEFTIESAPGRGTRVAARKWR